ncbi:kinase-like protein [Schizopora paradoxa]|uniref:Kinase-like protein n=1 Tax=Schizopora paradoxa TaxID=27342 RepID=A0A0H2RX58_9AGAM|nr:kinase-like protein [Schizopora paradoxa]
MWPAEDDYASSAPPLLPSRQWLDKIFQNYGERDINLAGQIFDIEPTPIGMGSTSDVFRAKSSKHNELVAVKRIRLFLLDNVEFAKSLSREMRIWSQLNHPNVLPLLGFFLDGPKGIPNFISKWMKNGTVVDYAKRKHAELKWNDETLRRIVREMAMGLDYLHDKRFIVHADLKGSNVLMSDDDRPLLADFGLAVSSSSGSLGQSAHHGNKGTLRWMAIELHKSLSSLDPSEIPRHTVKTDIWSFGMVVYEIIALKDPYASIKSDILVSKAILAGQLPIHPWPSLCQLRELFPSKFITQQIYTTVEACWNNDPQNRPSAKDIVFQLGGSVRLRSRTVVELIEATERKIETVNLLSFQTELGVPGSLLEEFGAEELAKIGDGNGEMEIVSCFESSTGSLAEGSRTCWGGTSEFV